MVVLLLIYTFFHLFNSFLFYSCLKLYCQCFASSTTCGPTCKCQVCHNTTLHGDDIEKARRTILERNSSAFDDKFRAPSAVILPSFSARGPSGWMPRQAPYPHQYQYHQQQQQQPMMRPPPHHPNMAPSPPRHSPTMMHMGPPPQQQQTFHHQPSGSPPPPPPPRHPNLMANAQGMTPSPTNGAPPYRVSPPPQMMQHTPTQSPPALAMPPPRMNKYGCKCRRSSCLKKVSLSYVLFCLRSAWSLHSI